MSVPQQRQNWYHLQWFADQDTKQERKLILKLDLLIVPYAFLAYWTKYIDQANINNAYVSGLKEDLGLHGNELVQLQTIYTIGAVVGQLPFAYLFTKLPMHWIIPFMDIAWGIFTLIQYRANSYAELAAYRFLVGWFEAAYYPGMHYIFGSWYRCDEISRRGGLFYVGLTLGTLTASLIQAGTSSSLDGVNGLSGWRWMYIVCAIITIPVAIMGYFLLPGTPDKPNKFILRDHDIALAKSRLQRASHKVEESPLKWQTVVKVGRHWKFWALLWLDIFFWNGSVNTTTGGYQLWLKSLNRFSTSRLNELAAASPGLGIFYTLLVCFSSDLLLGPAWAITVAHVWNIIGSVAMSSVLYGWINSQLRASPTGRAVTLVIVNMVSQSTTAWTPLLVFKTVEGPRFTKGYSFVLGNAICLIVLSHVVQHFISRQEKLEARNDRQPDPDSADDLGHLESGPQRETVIGKTIHD
ncbi:hypothetical protein N7523_009886 [Penicillium sp. IBT 18751x]|nr:hypothetical protein N7523_009886 [Penicillium sp. IBT 18751x]